MKLGITVNSIRSKGYFVDGDEERKQFLDELGFEWSMLDKYWADALLLLQTYKQENDHLEVPAAFVVPSTEPWPEELWGTKLGKTVNHIRSRGTFVKDNEERRQILDELGFVWRIRLSLLEKIRAAHAHHGYVRMGATALAE